MAEYTIELHDLIDSFTYPETLFDFIYPLHDPLHKNDLEQLIINHYYYREIGFETSDRFKHHLSMTMNEIMPKYNIMYEKLETDLIMLSNNSTENDMTASGSNSSETDTTNAGTTNNESLEARSETPQSAVDFTDIDTYASGLVKNRGEVTDSSTGNITGTGSNSNIANSLTKGYSGITESELRAIYFDNIVIVDNMIIKDLNDLFMKVY